MTTTALNCGFAWFLTVLSMVGYFYTQRKTGERLPFWPMLASGWMMFAVSHSLLLNGVSSTQWYMMVFRVLGYVLVICAILTLMLKPAKPEKPQEKKQ
jgi:cytochrome c biogenesis protein ResB